jgi:hypothetical protein
LRPLDTNLRKLPSRIKFFKTWQVCIFIWLCHYISECILFFDNAHN